MSLDTRRARAFAFLLDLLIAAAAADAIGLLLSAALWYSGPTRVGAVWAWPLAAAGGVLLFLLRDARGGRARRWLGLEVRDASGRPPGRWGSIRRNLPLLVPVWNLFEAWPVLRDGRATRSCDGRRGLQIVPWE